MSGTDDDSFPDQDRSRRHVNFQLLEEEEQFELLESQLSPNFLFEEGLPVGEARKSTCRELCWRVKMWCGCGRFCILLLCMKILILGIVIPVHLQSLSQAEGRSGGYDPNNFDEVDHHRNPGTSKGNLGIHDPANVPSASGENQVDYHDYHGHGHGHGNEGFGGKGDNENATPSEQGGDNIPVVILQDGDIIVEKHEEPLVLEIPQDPMGTQDTVPASKSTQGQCSTSEEKLESVLEMMGNIQSTLIKLEELMQGSATDEHVEKCVESIRSGNLTLARKHWEQLLKYGISKSSAISRVVKEAYNGNEKNILLISSFVEAIGKCEGFSVLQKEMQSYDRLQGHSYIFPVALATSRICGTASKEYESLPKTVKQVLQGSFTLRNKLNRGYLYYAKRCVSKHYYHCLDVLTKRVAEEEFSSMEEGGDEWRRYRWKLNATDSTGNSFFLVNEDKYTPYRLQDVPNSPRFRMEEASNQFETEMAAFILMLGEDEGTIKIRLRDPEDFVEGEDMPPSKIDALLTSFHKTPGKIDDPKGISWIVGLGNEDDHQERQKMIGRRSLNFPI